VASQPDPTDIGTGYVGKRQTKLIVSFSTGMKANIGNYESVDSHLSRTEEWDVSDMSPAEIDKLWTERYGRIKEQLDGMIEHDYLETSIYALAKELPEASFAEYQDPEENDSI
jgi:hypothetical protein